VRHLQTYLRPLLRSLAALTLVMFVVAQTACFIHCHFGGGHGTAGKPSCHGTAHAKSSPGKHVPSAPSIPCATLKSLVAGGDAFTFAAPVLHLVPSFALPVDSLVRLGDAPDLADFRQSKFPDQVHTPEVCLGPAFRSLAPPFVG
jgi:hypothetical protein